MSPNEAEGCDLRQALHQLQSFGREPLISGNLNGDSVMFPNWDSVEDKLNYSRQPRYAEFLSDVYGRLPSRQLMEVR
jgi:uncharacterized membrane protein